MTTDFLDLPSELVVQILSLLPLRDLVACQCTNRYWYDLIRRDSSLLQYCMQTQAAGLDDNPRSHLSVAEKLETLRRREHAWAHLQVSQKITVPVEHIPSGIYDLTSGVYLLGDALDGGIFSPTNVIHYLLLPTLDSTLSPASPEWSTITVDHKIVDLGLCVQEHDLIAVVTSRRPPNTPLILVIEIVLLDFFTGSHHPLASQPVIHVVTQASAFGHCSVGVEIVGDNLALLVTYPYTGRRADDRLYIYDWKSGNLKASMAADNLSYYSIVFLSSDVLLLPNMRTGSLDVYRLYDGPEPIALELSLGLPPLTADHLIFRMVCRAEPNPMGDSPTSRRDTTGSADPTQGRPFRSSPHDAIIVFNLLLRHAFGPRLFSYSFVVHRKSILHLLSSNPRGSTDVIPWHHWGLPITRWFDTDDIPTRWITVSTGQRYVSILSSAHDISEPIQIYDFNPHTVRRHSQGVAADSSVDSHDSDSRLQSSVIWDMTRIPAEGIFEQDIWSALPFVKFTSTTTYDYDAVLMDEETIIGMRLDEVQDKVTSIDILNIG